MSGEDYLFLMKQFIEEKIETNEFIQGYMLKFTKDPTLYGDEQEDLFRLIERAFFEIDDNDYVSIDVSEYALYEEMIEENAQATEDLKAHIRVTYGLLKTLLESKTVS